MTGTTVANGAVGGMVTKASAEDVLALERQRAAARERLVALLRLSTDIWQAQVLTFVQRFEEVARRARRFYSNNDGTP